MADDKNSEQPEWKRSLPFPRHWIVYIVVKLVILAVAVLIALRLYGFF